MFYIYLYESELLSFSVIGVPWGGAWTWVVDKSFGVLLVPSIDDFVS